VAVLRNSIPAERTDSGKRWVVDPKDIPSVIQHFSLLKEEK
jgi:hypothetical protein